MTSSHSKLKGRDKEALEIQIADKQSALGRLMLGELDSWEDFLKPSITDYASLPRKQLKSGHADIKKRLKGEINSFYSRNFVDLNSKRILELYEEIKSARGLQIPLSKFEDKFGKIKKTVLKGCPAHLTVSITLWGLKYLFPEDLLSKDILAALEILKESREQIKRYELKEHRFIKQKTNEFIPQIRQIEFVQRAVVLSCFNLMESYINGLAWDYCQSNDLSALSNRKQKLLTDTSSVSIRDKLTKYPAIIVGRDDVEVDGVDKFLNIIKPFRDSLVHPSPFSAPEKFGGYHKLKKLYELDYEVAIMAVKSTILVIKNTFALLETLPSSPKWLERLESWLIENHQMTDQNNIPPR